MAAISASELTRAVVHNQIGNPMPTFEYQASGPSGEVVNSVAFGRNVDEVLQYLGRQGLKVEHIQDAYAKADPLAQTRSEVAPRPPVVGAVPIPTTIQQPAKSIWEEREEVVQTQPPDPITKPRNYFLTSVLGPIFGKVPLRDQSFFFRQFGAMVDAGVPMVQLLGTLSSQARTPKFRNVIKELQTHAQENRPISAGMQRYPEVFSPLVLSLVRAGEEGGFLADALMNVAMYLEEEIELRNMYKRETFLPKLQLFASMIIIIGANLIIGAINKRNQTTAPGLSSPLTTLSTWYVILPVLIGLFLFFRVGLANYAIKQAWDAIMLRIPFLGKTLHHFAMAKFGRAFSALYKGGVAIPRAITLSADACGNEYLRGRIYPAVDALQNGAGITDTLRSTRAFSDIVMNMMATGEATGNMDQMLTKMSEYYESEGKVRAKQLASVVGVVVVILLGIYVLYVVANFYLGYFGGLLSGL